MPDERHGPVVGIDDRQQLLRRPQDKAHTLFARVVNDNRQRDLLSDSELTRIGLRDDAELQAAAYGTEDERGFVSSLQFATGLPGDSFGVERERHFHGQRQFAIQRRVLDDQPLNGDTARPDGFVLFGGDNLVLKLIGRDQIVLPRRAILRRLRGYTTGR